MQLDIQNISKFYQKGHYNRRHLDEYFGYLEPLRLGIAAISAKEDDTTIYEDKLLPGFIEFAKKHNFDIFSFDLKQERERYIYLLDAFVEEISATPIIFENEVYFVRCEQKEGGIPSDLEKRAAFIESKPLFDYTYYKVSEARFFEMIASYVNLYNEHEKIQRQNSRLWTVASLVGLVIVALGFSYLGLDSDGV